MKYAVVLCDGMADYPVDELGGKTPMECAQKPIMDKLGENGEVGIVRTVAPGLKPGSDVANLSVMGYDPAIYYTGRSPLEAASMGLELADDDVAIRCNLVTLSDEENYADRVMLDYCAGDISTAEAAELIASVQEALGSEIFSFTAGVSYRHCLVWKGGNVNCGFLTPPHDIPNKVVGEYLCAEPDAAPLIDLMKRSTAVLKDHPVNKKRIAEGKRPATSIWLWGQGTRPQLDSFESKFGLKGTVVSAVDLIRGIAKCAGMENPLVEGATGYVDTCFERKTEVAVEALKRGQDFVYLHFEAPDECGHRHEVENKIKSIEYIDSRCLDILIKGLKEIGDDYRIMILPDHPTPICVQTHVSDPVPYIIYDSREQFKSGVKSINENTAKETGMFTDVGHTLMNRFLGKITGGKMEHKGTHTIETERLILRRIRPNDAQAMFDNWTSDPEVTKFLVWPTHESVEVSKAIADMWVKDYEKPDFYQWAFTLKGGDDKPFGTISVVNIFEGINAMEIGYCIGRNFWHKGYTSEALEGVIGWLFENIKELERIEARHDARNPNSGRVMKHAGMQYEGTRRKGDRNNSGIHDCCGYAILREDYEKLKK